MKQSRMRSRLELTIALTLFFLVCYAGGCDMLQRSLAEDVVRLRVIASSDMDTDQQIKLQVRDHVLELMQPLQEQAQNQKEMQQLLREHMQEIVNQAQQTVYACGSHEPVTACLKEEWYPTRDYEAFALPAGTYEGLQIRIGEAQGRNWWCVLYPSLCLNAADGDEKLTEEEYALIHQQDTGYTIHFRTAEFLGNLRRLVK